MADVGRSPGLTYPVVHARIGLAGLREALPYVGRVPSLGDHVDGSRMNAERGETAPQS
jgi:hypothetical protein